MSFARRSLAATLITTVLLLGSSVAWASAPTVPVGAVDSARGLDRAPHAPSPRAFEISRRDGNDTKGPLDLRSMTMSRGNGFDTVTIKTIGRFTNAQIDPDRGNFAVLIDNDDDRTYEYGLYVFSVKGKLRGVLAKPNGRIVDRSPVARLNSRTLRTEIQRVRIKSPGTYRFAVFSATTDRPCTARRPCVDAIPNRFPLLALDHTAPVVQLIDVPAFSTHVSETTTFPISFKVGGDPQGTKVTWTLEQRQDGGPWTTVDSGTGNVTDTVQIAGVEGSVYEFRLSADDKQQHPRTAEASKVVPFDDDDPGLTYAGAWAVDATSSSFDGSEHLSPDETSEADGLTVSGSFTGSVLCIVGGHPTANGSARVTIDGSPTFSVHQSPTTGLGDPDCSSPLPSGPHTFVLAVTRDIVSVDGYYVLP